MITIYKAKETDFSHNGLCILKDCIRCIVAEELNGQYELELECPISNKKAEYLEEDSIIKATTPQGVQLFRIYRKAKNMSSVICYARHIFFDFLDYYIEDVRPTECTGNTALKAILNSTSSKHNFIGQSDIRRTNTAYYIRQSPATAIIGEDENSFLNRWGGEILRDNFKIKILNNIGNDNGVTIRYGKNLIGIEEDLDMSNIATRIYPTGLSKDDTVIELPEKYIDSPYVNSYGNIKAKHIALDVKIDHEEGKIKNKEDVYRELRKQVEELYTSKHIDVPKANYRVNFVELSKTEEYKHYKVLETIHLGDTVTVTHNKLGINIKSKVIKYVWDCLSNRYVEIELGNFKDNLAIEFNNINSSIEKVKEDIKEDNKKFRSKIEQQDDRITLNVEEIGKTNTRLELTADSIKTEINDTERHLNSKIKQQADKISLIVDGDGDIKGAEISMAIADNKSAIKIISDNIDIMPRSGIINFPNGQDIDCRGNGIRVRKNSSTYILVEDGLHVYNGGHNAVWTFNRNGAYFCGKKVKIEFE